MKGFVMKGSFIIKSLTLLKKDWPDFMIQFSLKLITRVHLKIFF